MAQAVSDDAPVPSWVVNEEHYRRDVAKARNLWLALAAELDAGSSIKEVRSWVVSTAFAGDETWAYQIEAARRAVPETVPDG